MYRNLIKHAALVLYCVMPGYLLGYEKFKTMHRCIPIMSQQDSDFTYVSKYQVVEHKYMYCRARN